MKEDNCVFNNNNHKNNIRVKFVDMEKKNVIK